MAGEGKDHPCAGCRYRVSNGQECTWARSHIPMPVLAALVGYRDESPHVGRHGKVDIWGTAWMLERHPCPGKEDPNE